MPTTPTPRAELLLSATLLLLTDIANKGACPGQIVAIRQHLDMIAGHAGIEAMVRETCRSLSQGLGGEGPAARMALRSNPAGSLH